MPDELARGHVLRMQLANGIRTHELALKALRLHLQTSSRGISQSSLTLAAQAAGLDVDTYTVRHTFLHYWLFSGAGSRACTSLWNRRVRQLTMTAPAPRLRWCEDCAQSDLRYHGFTYWRRSHQVAGATYCPEHETVLRTSAQATIKTDRLPHHPHRSWLTRSGRGKASERASILRYQLLGTMLASCAEPLNQEVHAQRALTWLGRKLRASNGPEFALKIFTVAEKTFGRTWLCERWSGAPQRCGATWIGNPFSPLASRCAAQPLEPLMLALTALTGTVEEALDVFTADLTST